MKKLFLLSLILFLFIACNEKTQRYFADSVEIETLKAEVKAYENDDWDNWKSHFSDTAKIFINSIKPLTVKKRQEGLQAMTADMASYGFNHDKEYVEMVLDKEDETWVYYWATHTATLASNNKEVSFPVHLSVQFVDGKIVEEHAYFDASSMNAAFAVIEAAAEQEAEKLLLNNKKNN